MHAGPDDLVCNFCRQEFESAGPQPQEDNQNVSQNQAVEEDGEDDDNDPGTAQGNEHDTPEATDPRIQPPAAHPEEALSQPAEIVPERYDRQARISGWSQKKLENTALTIIGYNTFSEYLALSASALGIKSVCIIATPQDLQGAEAPMLALSNAQTRAGRLEEMMKKVGGAGLECIVASMTSGPDKFFLSGSSAVVDVTGRHESRALALDAGNEGAKNHTELVHFYEGGFLMLSHRDNLNPLYGKQAVQPDIINAMLAAGVTLSEVAKSAAFEKCEKKETVAYGFSNIKKSNEAYTQYKVLLIGAGALGNFVGQGLAALGFNLVDILDFDTIETTNLNRQMLFYESVGQQKAKVLAERCAAMRGPDAKYESITEKFDENFDIKEYDLVIDCVDNFAARALISKKCVEEKIPLVSAGTSYNSGQATVYLPGKTRCADHALGWSSQAEREAEQQARMIREGGCLMQPNPAVIMSNQVMAAIMLNMARQVFHPDKFGEPASGYMMYRADSPNRFGWVGLELCKD
ncbi:MAG: ThiF family adenylyltransferase [DPANN group archaeon]|nr:ThiF family adenylyltransferase [DPANN group archaeon]